MRAAILGFTAICSALASCSIEHDGDQLSGYYMETSPAVGRSALEFLHSNRMVRHERNSTHTDTFFFSIDTGRIHLIPVWQPDHDATLEIEIINSESFRIEDMYPTTGIGPKMFMTFEK